MKKFALMAILMAGCSSTPTPIQVGPDRWTATISSVSPAKAMNAAMRAASNHCTERGQIVNVVERKTIPPALLGGYRGHTADVTFTCSARQNSDSN